MKILHISDCHFGLQYATIKSVEARNTITEARLKALQNAVDIANIEKCDAFIIAGDLFENHNVTQKLIKSVCAILNEFNNGTVYVLPGNHDYYNDDEPTLWNYFSEVCGDNIYLFTENKMLEAVINGEKVRFYPCICHDKHASENALGWVKEEELDSSFTNIGIAHGSLSGLSFDREGDYYSMSPEELNDIPVDVWLLGHAHVPEPACEYDKVIGHTRIYNAGTHQQTNIHNNVEGSVFVIDIGNQKYVRAKRVKTGIIRFLELVINVTPDDEIEKLIEEKLSGIDVKNTVLRLTVNGTVNSDEYEKRQTIEKLVSEKVLYLDKIYLNITKEITTQMIDEETMTGSIENKLLKKYVDEPDILAAAYELVMSCKEN